MILDHVAYSAGLIIEGAAALDPEILCHRDLNALHIVAVPKRFHECICEAEGDHVIHRPLPQIVVDSENCAFVEPSEKDSIEMLRRWQVMPERLLDDDPTSRRTATLLQLLEHWFEHSGRDREVMRWPLRSP